MFFFLCRAGEFCQCDTQEFSNINLGNCKMNNETLSPVCSDNGECECGVCQCSVVPVSHETSWMSK